MSRIVATIDLSTYLGHHVRDVVASRYRTHAGLPTFMVGGLYFVAVVDLPEGPHIDGFYAFEGIPGPGYERLLTEDGAHLLEIWGWQRPNPIPADIEAGPRALTVDMAQHVEPSSVIFAARTIGRMPDGRVVMDAEFETPRSVLNQPSHGVYDTLDEHPADLRAVVERFPQERRSDASSQPPSWVPIPIIVPPAPASPPGPP